MRPITLAVVCLLCACTGATHLPPSRASPPTLTEWKAPLYRDHPLAGRIWDVANRRFLPPEALPEALKSARYVLLGERHDHPDHHRLQAELVRAVASPEHRPALAFEMLDVSQQPAVDAALPRAEKDPDALADAVGWASSGWPDWSLYRPIFVEGLDAKLPIIAANLPRAQVRDLVMRGPEALPPDLRAKLQLDVPEPEDEARAVREELDRAHCGQLPQEMLGPMALAQRARDAFMAVRLREKATEAGALLITGNGHARTDRGVPAHLRDRAPEVTVRSVAFLEVNPKALEPQDYADPAGAQTLPYDYIWFTPALPEDDPCAPLRKRASMADISSGGPSRRSGRP